MSALLVVLYAVCLTLLTAAAVLVLRKAPHSRLHRTFVLVYLALTLWLLSLAALFHSGASPYLTLVGRLNFASILWAAYLGYLFMRELVNRPLAQQRVLTAATLLLSAVIVLTPWVDRRELVQGSQHVTLVGPLFVLFAIPVVLFPAAAVVTSFAALRHASVRLKRQLSVVGLGLALTTAVAIPTGIVLPYLYHNFAYEELGALSVVFLVSAVAYAITVQHLLDVRIVIRHALVITVLVAVVEKVYSGGIELLVRAVPQAQRSPAIHEAVSLATVLFIAVSFYPLRRWLEKQLDGLLFRRRPGRRPSRVQPSQGNENG